MGIAVIDSLIVVEHFRAHGVQEGRKIEVFALDGSRVVHLDTSKLYSLQRSNF